MTLIVKFSLLSDQTQQFTLHVTMNNKPCHKSSPDVKMLKLRNAKDKMKGQEQGKSRIKSSKIENDKPESERFLSADRS